MKHDSVRTVKFFDNVTFLRYGVQNAFLSIKVTESGITTSINEVPMKAYDPIVRTVLGIFIDVNLHILNEEPPIPITPKGILTFPVNFVGYKMVTLSFEITILFSILKSMFSG